MFCLVADENLCPKLWRDFRKREWAPPPWRLAFHWHRIVLKTATAIRWWFKLSMDSALHSSIEYIPPPVAYINYLTCSNTGREYALARLIPNSVVYIRRSEAEVEYVHQYEWKKFEILCSIGNTVVAYFNFDHFSASLCGKSCSFRTAFYGEYFHRSWCMNLISAALKFPIDPLKSSTVWYRSRPVLLSLCISHDGKYSTCTHELNIYHRLDSFLNSGPILFVMIHLLGHVSRGTYYLPPSIW